MKEFLTDVEITKIETMCSDEVLFEAVRKVMLAGIYTHGTLPKGEFPNPLVNGALQLVSVSSNNPMTDEVLGQHIRGVWEGLNALENAMNRLKEIKANKPDAVESPYNEAV